MDGKPSPEVVVVTGSAGGVGRAVAHAFGKRGARVGLVARGERALSDAKEEVESFGGEALAVPTDVADAGQVERAAQAVESEFGPIDVWVNVAMATVFARFLDVEPEEYQRATEVSYLGFVWGTMSALKRMVPRDRGTVVQIGSALAYRAIPLQSAYCGAKFAIRGFTDTVRTELLNQNSKVWITMVQLPAVNTPQFNWCRSKLSHHPQPVPPIYQPEIPAEAAYYAAHHRRREIYVGGSCVAVILGNKLFPGLADRYLAKTGVKSQQIPDKPVSPDRPNNLFEPVEEEAATHGIFNDRSHSRSYQLWATTHRPAVWGGVAIGTLAAAAGISRLVPRRDGEEDAAPKSRRWGAVAMGARAAAAGISRLAAR